jgi:pimeloyl-ACP methyl ester carboxylesterase
MVSVRVLGLEIAAIGRAAVWLSTQRGRRPRPYDPTLPHPTPVVFVHGFLGDRTNFRLLEDALDMRGVSNVVYFEYPPRFDWPRLATLLGRAIDAVRLATGVRRVDVVGHSLGGLVARYLVDMRSETPIRRLVTLCAPYFGTPLPPNELAVFGAHDPIVPVPHPDYGPHAPHLHPNGRVVVVPECGHWGVLVHERVANEVSRFLVSPDLALTHAGPRRLEQRSDRLTA